MKLSTKGRYGTRFMLRLALAGPGVTCTLKEIARQEAISEKYLWQIARSLKDAGFIHAAPGAHGGYRLARDPAGLNLDDILTALEGEIALVDCGPRPASCRRSADCVARTVWAELTQKFRSTLAEVRLTDLMQRYRDMHPERSGDYAI
jgi:Rrf2 family protein